MSLEAMAERDLRKEFEARLVAIPEDRREEYRKRFEHDLPTLAARLAAETRADLAELREPFLKAIENWSRRQAPKEEGE